MSSERSSRRFDSLAARQSRVFRALAGLDDTAMEILPHCIRAIAHLPQLRRNNLAYRHLAMRLRLHVQGTPAAGLPNLRFVATNGPLL